MSTLRLLVPAGLALVLADTCHASEFPDYYALRVTGEVATNPERPEEARQAVEVQARVEHRVLDGIDLRFDGTARAQRDVARKGTADGGSDVFYDRELVIDELTAAYAGDNYDVVVGQQIQVLGRADAFQVLDRLNERDLCRFSRLDLDYKRAIPLAQLRVFVDDVTLRGIVAPFSPENEISDFRESCADMLTNAATFAGVEDPGSDDLDDWAGALEVTYLQDEYEVGLNVITLKEPDFALQTFPAFAKERPRAFWFGGSGSTNALGGVVRAEAAFSPERTFTLDPRETAALAMGGVPTDGTEERWNGIALVGYEFSYDDWTADAQLMVDFIESGSATVRPEVQSFASLRLRKSFMNDRLSAQLFSVYDLTNQDVAGRLEFRYEIDDKSSLEFGVVHYEDIADDAGFFGTFDGRSEVFISLTRDL